MCQETGTHSDQCSNDSDVSLIQYYSVNVKACSRKRSNELVNTNGVPEGTKLLIFLLIRNSSNFDIVILFDSKQA